MVLSSEKAAAATGVLSGQAAESIAEAAAMIPVSCALGLEGLECSLSTRRGRSRCIMSIFDVPDSSLQQIKASQRTHATRRVGPLAYVSEAHCQQSLDLAVQVIGQPLLPWIRLILHERSGFSHERLILFQLVLRKDTYNPRPQACLGSMRCCVD